MACGANSFSLVRPTLVVVRFFFTLGRPQGQTVGECSSNKAFLTLLCCFWVARRDKKLEHVCQTITEIMKTMHAALGVVP